MKKKFLAIVCCLFFCCAAFLSPTAYAAAFHTDFDTASAGIELINLDTGTVVYEKNPNAKREPASTTKIMTFIVVSEQIPDLENTKITIKKSVLEPLQGTNSSIANLKAGDELTALQLLNCMMVPSGNDAAEVLADYVGGGNVQKFVDLMNNKAKELGASNTHFANAHGLHDENHYTTAHDLATISRYAMSLPHFSEITNQRSYTYKPLGGSEAGVERTIYTTNRMINPNSQGGYYYRYARGIKTGSHNEAGYCLVSTATKGGYTYMCVALGAPKVDASGKTIENHAEMTDSKKLYEWAFSNLEMKNILSSEDSVGEIKLDYAWNQDKLLLVPEKNFSTILPKDVDASSILVTKNVPQSVAAPIKKGQVIGTATLSYAGQNLATVKLTASQSVERSEVLHTADIIKKIVTSPWLLALVAVIILLVVVYVVLALIYNRKKKNLRRVKKYRRM